MGDHYRQVPLYDFRLAILGCNFLTTTGVKVRLHVHSSWIPHTLRLCVLCKHWCSANKEIHLATSAKCRVGELMQLLHSVPTYCRYQTNYWFEPIKRLIRFIETESWYCSFSMAMNHLLFLFAQSVLAFYWWASRRWFSWWVASLPPLQLSSASCWRTWLSWQVCITLVLHHQLLLIAHYIISYSGLPIASSVIVDYHISAHYIINYLENLNMGCFHLKNPAYYTVCYFH